MLYLLPLILSIIINIIINNNKIIIIGIISLLINLILIGGDNIIKNNDIIILIYIILIIILYYIRYKGDYNNNIIIGIMIIGIYLTINSTSILSLIISIEILSFLIIIIINFYLLDLYPGILYFIFSSLFTSLLILGFGYIYYGHYISLNIIKYYLFFKLGLFPFHFLLPNIYLNLSLKYIYLIDIPYKLIILYILIKLNININNLIMIDLIYILFNLIFSSIAIYNNHNLLIIYLYSSIFNYSLILLFSSIISLINIHILISYIIMYFLINLIFINLIFNYNIKTIKYNKGINNYNIIIIIIILLNYLSLPPLMGFKLKINLFNNIIKNSFLFDINDISIALIYILILIILILIISLIYINLLISFFSFLLSNSSSTPYFNNNLFFNIISILTILTII